MSMEARAYIRKQMKNHIRCLAVVGRKKFVRSLFKIISSFVDIGLEMKIFEKEEEAVKWLLEKITD